MSAADSARAGDGNLPLAERLGDMRHYLNEAHQFAAMSPRGRDCIGIVLDLLDEMEPEVTALAAAPAAPSVQTGPRTEFVLNELRSALLAMTTFFGMDEDEASKPTFDKARQAHRALPLAADWPTRRAFIPQGCDQQGRLTPTIKSAEPFPVVVDRAREDFDAEDQSESADSEVMSWLLKGLTVVLLACFCAWCIASYLVLAHA